ncbi:hypothetical protein Emag_001790 [Eimeria magna]
MALLNSGAFSIFVPLVDLGLCLFSSRKSLSLSDRQGGYQSACRANASQAAQCARLLQQLVSPLLLRRHKTDALHNLNLPYKKEERERTTSSRLQVKAGFVLANGKVLFCSLTPIQYRIYKDVLESLCNSNIYSSSSSSNSSSSSSSRFFRSKGLRHKALATLTILRKVCNHPDLVLLLQQRQLQQQQLQLEQPIPRSRKLHIQPKRHPVLQQQQQQQQQQESNTAAAASLIEDFGSPQKSGKLRVLLAMLSAWRAEGHKALVFTQTQETLDLIVAAVSSAFSSPSVHLDAGAHTDRDTLREGEGAATTAAGAAAATAGVEGTDEQQQQQEQQAEARRHPRKERQQQLVFLRLDGSTPICKRPALILRFQTDEVCFCLLSCCSFLCS